MYFRYFEDNAAPGSVPRPSDLTRREFLTLTTVAGTGLTLGLVLLNALPPDIEPRATDYVKQMIALAETLIKKKHAYVAENHVLFNVPSMKNYGELSRRPRDELIAGARVDVAPYKKDPAD